MDTAVLKLYGDIGESDPMMQMLIGEDQMVSAKMVSDFLDENKEAKNLTVRINSRGGDVQEGWTIHDLIANSGKKIKTIVEGKVYSIATVIFLAGTEREIMKNADGLIHNPFIPPYTLAGQYESGDLASMAETLKQEEEKILDYYAERTGTAKDKLATYMKDETKLSAQDMLDLGFATKIIEPVKAYAYLKTKNNSKMDNDIKTLGQKLDTLIDKFKNFSRLTPADQTMKDKDGKEFKLEKETGEPAVGDKASPDGVYVMANGKTITVSGGSITKIDEPIAAKTELEIANEKIATLEADLKKLKDEKPDLVAAEASFKDKEKQAKDLIVELQNLKNSWTPQGRTRVASTEGKVGEIDLNRVKELSDKLKPKIE